MSTTQDAPDDGPRLRHRFYCQNLPAPNGGSVLSAHHVELDSPQARHAQRVLRLQTGDAVELFDGRGLVGSGRLEADGRVRLADVRHVEAATPLISVAAALPKAGRADDMVAALSQVGADELIPLQTDRATVTARAGRLQRYQKLVIESAKQCRRAHLMRVGAPTNLQQVLADDHDLRLIAQPDGKSPNVARLTAAQRVLILIGPEGGWSDDELQQAAAHGCLPWSIGPHLMRIETAAPAAVALARYLTRSSL